MVLIGALGRGGRESVDHSCSPPLKRWATQPIKTGWHGRLARVVTGGTPVPPWFC